MKLGYHDVKVVSFETGTNDNGKKMMEIMVANQEDEQERITIYFSTPEGIKRGLQDLQSLGWEKGKPLDVIIGARANIEVYEEAWEDRNKNKRMSLKARFARADRPSQIKAPMSRNAATAWLEGLADPKAREW